MKKLFLCTLCLLTLVNLTGCRRDKNNDVPAPNPNGTVSDSGNGTVNGGSGTTQTPDPAPQTPDGTQTPGQTAQDVLDGAKRTVQEIWDDMKVTAADLTDLPMTDAEGVLTEWGIDKTLVEEHLVKRFTDPEGGRVMLIRVKPGHASEVAAALKSKGVSAQVWEKGDYVLVADSERAKAIADSFNALNF